MFVHTGPVYLQRAGAIGGKPGDTATTAALQVVWCYIQDVRSQCLAFLVAAACSPDNVLPTAPCHMALQTADRNDQGTIECTASVDGETDSATHMTAFVLSTATSASVPTLSGTLFFYGPAKLNSTYNPPDIVRDTFTILDGSLSASVSQCPSCTTMGSASVTFSSVGETVEGGWIIMHGQLVLGFDNFTGPSKGGVLVVDF